MSQWSDIPAVILAAGEGARMAAGGLKIPKPLLPVLDEALVARQAAWLHRLGVRRFVTVNTERDEEGIEDAVARGVWDSGGRGARGGAQLVQYAQRKPAGIVDALLLAASEERFPKPFLVVLGDIFFLPVMSRMRNLPTLLEGGAAAAIVSKREKRAAPVRENFSIVADGDGKVIRVAEKPLVPESLLKGVGLYLLSPQCVPVLAGERPGDLTAGLQLLIDRGMAVAHGEAVRADVNVNAPADLWRANMAALAAEKGLPPQGYVADTAYTEFGIALQNCVIMRGVELHGHGAMKRVVVLPGTEAELDDAELEDCLIAEECIPAGGDE